MRTYLYQVTFTLTVLCLCVLGVLVFEWITNTMNKAAHERFEQHQTEVVNELQQINERINQWNAETETEFDAKL